jgi:hypothetical protein
MTPATVAATAATLGTGPEVTELTSEFGVEGVVEADGLDVAARANTLGTRFAARGPAFALAV